MEGRPSRGRGGSWKRGGRGGNDGDGFGGEHRGRGRAGSHRGRAKREQHRGRGRGGGARTAEFHHRDQDGGDDFEEENRNVEVFSKRKLESNWDRYEESERQEPDDDMPTQRGTDYHVLLESAGDSFTQFRFSEEKDWDMDCFTASQMLAMFVDLPALAQSLQEVPLHQRLNLEAELVQVSAPVELPTLTLAPKQEMPQTSASTAPSATLKSFSTNKKDLEVSVPVSRSDSQVSSNAAELLPDDGDEELDQLLSLQKPVSSASENQSVGVTIGENAAPERALKEMVEVPEVKEEEMERDEEVPPPASAPVKPEMTEEDLEDWLDSMIS